MIIIAIPSVVFLSVLFLHESPGSRAAGIVVISMLHALNVGENGMVLPFSNIAAGEVVSQRLRADTFGLAYAL